MEEIKKDVSTASSKKVEKVVVPAVTEFKALKDLNQDDLEKLPIFKCELSKSVSNNGKNNSNVAKIYRYSATLTVIPSLIRRRISLEDYEYSNILVKSGLNLDYQNTTIGARARLSKGTKANGNLFYLVEVFFTPHVRKSFFLTDIDIENIIAMKKDSMFITRPDKFNDIDVVDTAKLFGNTEDY